MIFQNFPNTTRHFAAYIILENFEISVAVILPNTTTGHAITYTYTVCMMVFRHMDDSEGRAYELQQAAVKCMRGILFCYMRQADKVSFINYVSLCRLVCLSVSLSSSQSSKYSVISQLLIYPFDFQSETLGNTKFCNF